MKLIFYYRILLLSAGLLFCAFAVTAQGPITVQWDKTLGGSDRDQPHDIIPTADGGYLLSGSSESNATEDKTEDNKGNFDYWIVKIVETAEEEFFIKNFALVNADTDKTIAPLQEKDMINLSELGNPRLSIRANTTPIKVDSVKLELSGPITHTQVERYYPYALFGDEPDGPRDYIGLQWKAGEYILKATPLLQDKVGTALTISFSVIDNNNNARLAVEVFPVPTTGRINIMHEGTTEETHMMLLDHRGQVLLSRPLQGQTVEELDLSSFKKGLYYLKVVNREALQVNRVVVE